MTQSSICHSSFHVRRQQSAGIQNFVDCECPRQDEAAVYRSNINAFPRPFQAISHVLSQKASNVIYALWLIDPVSSVLVFMPIHHLRPFK